MNRKVSHNSAPPRPCGEPYDRLRVAIHSQDSSSTISDAEVVLIGGGIAALWSLARLRARGFRAVLIEPAQLGQGQSLASQGIIHGGLKYTLSGLFNARAAAIAGMPERWRQALAGEPLSGDPNLSTAKVLSPYCYLWRTGGLAGTLGMIGARVGLQTTPIAIEGNDVPALLSNTKGGVYRVDEPVVDSKTVLGTLRDGLADSMLAADGVAGIGWDGMVLHVRSPSGASTTFASVRQIIVAAGAWSDQVLTQLGAPNNALFLRRPLHMGVVRARESSASLTAFFGHCVDGKETRVTITSAPDANGRMIWQIGGRLAEEGVVMTDAQLHARLKAELRQVLPNLAVDALEFANYRIDRMEFKHTTRQEDAELHRITNTLSVALPLKLALAPLLAERIEADLRAQGIATHERATPPIAILAQPALGVFPWEQLPWTS